VRIVKEVTKGDFIVVLPQVGIVEEVTKGDLLFLVVEGCKSVMLGFQQLEMHWLDDLEATWRRQPHDSDLQLMHLAMLLNNNVSQTKPKPRKPKKKWNFFLGLSRVGATLAAGDQVSLLLSVVSSAIDHSSQGRLLPSSRVGLVR
jgi:hypothetical protein